jgi:hypothetical protein
MDEQVRSELADILKTGGRNLCTMPQVLGTLLRQRCPEAETTVAEVQQALAFGCVRSMLEAVGPVDVLALADRFVSQSGMAPDRALWVIETWAHALAAADTPPPLGRDWSAWNRLDVKSASGAGAYQQAISNLIGVAAAGAIGGAVVALFVSIGGEATRFGSLESLEDAAPWVQAVAFLFLGLLGGLAGGVIGWIGFGGRSFAHDATGGTTFGRWALSATGACVGGGSGVVAGLAVLGLIGVMIGALFGAVLGILAAELILRFWP